MERQGRALLIIYPLVKGVKHQERHWTNVFLVCLERAVNRLGACSGLQKPLQHTGHAAPAALSPVPTGRAKFNPNPALSESVKKTYIGIL